MRIRLRALFFCVFLFTLALGCTTVDQDIGPPSSGKPSSPMAISLSFSSPPELDETTTLLVEVTPGDEAPNTLVTIEIPEGFELIEGARSWSGDLQKDQNKKFSLVVKPIEFGNWTFSAEAVSRHADGYEFGRTTKLYVALSETGTQISEEAFVEEDFSSASTAESGDKPQSPMQVNLAFDSPPDLKQIAQLSIEVSSTENAPNTSIRFERSTGIELQSSFKGWTGDIGKNEIVSIKLPIKVTQTGNESIAVEAISSQDSYVFGKTGNLFLDVSESSTTVSETPPMLSFTGDAMKASTEIRDGFRQVEPTGPILETTQSSKLNGSNGVAVDNVQGTVTVYGYWEYRDRGGYDHPIRDARVEIWDEDSTSADDLLATVYTNNSGYYTATVDNSDAWLGIDVYVKVFSTDNFSVRVTDFDASPDLYYSQTPTTDDISDGSFYVGTYVVTDSTNRMAWYIYDVIANDAYDFLYYNVSWVNSYNLQVRWTPTSTHGTHYHFDGSIDLLAGDRWDEDVILHEYGHFVMDKIYTTYPPTPSCNPHQWGVHSSRGCAWSEGWATFLQGAIQGHDDYVDTEDQTLHHYMEPPNPAAHHPEDEGAVAASLWDIFDSRTESHDTLANGINGASNNGIWKIVYTYDPVDVMDFWSDWDSSTNGFECQVTTILRHHTINVTDRCPPAAPTGVSASDGSFTDRIRIIWSSSSGATSYQVYRAVSPTGTKTYLGSTSNSWFDDFSPTHMRIYYYWVTACNANGCSGYSSYNSGWRQMPLPTGVNATDGSYTDKVRVTWNSVSGANGYQVFRSTSFSGAKTYLGQVSNTPFDDTSATQRRVYYYWVKACNSYGCSDFSAYNTGWREMAAPTGVNASDGTYTDKVHITWNSISGATYYEVYRATSPGGVKTLLGSPTGSLFDDTSAAPVTTYYYWVIACNSYGCGNYSSYDSGWRALPIPPIPTNVQASDGIYTDKIRITWNSSTGATSYQVYRAPVGGTPKTLLGTPTGTSFDDTTATVATTWLYYVKACNVYGCSDYSTVETGWRALIPPTGVSASDGAFTDKVRITWSSSPSATSYNVWRATSAGGSKTLLGSTSGTVHDDTSAATATTYFYWAQACANSYCSAYSSYDTGWRNLIAPTGVSASDGTFTDKVRITWNSVSGATSYMVYRATSAGGTKTFLGSPTGTMYDDTSAAMSATYYYWVRACASGFCSFFSNYDTGWRAAPIPPVPTNVQASDGIYTDKIRITWNSSTGATSYQVYRAPVGGTPKTLLGTPTGTSFDDTTASAATTYLYYVKACNVYGCSDYSAVETGWRALIPPTGVSASDGTYTDKVRITWSSSPSATSYNIYRATSAGGTKTLLGSTSGTVYDDTSAAVATAYFYWIQACANSYCSTYSSYDTGWRAPIVPTGLSASDGTFTDKVRITWNSVTGATSYKVYRATSAGGAKTLLGSTSGTLYDDTSASIGITYYYWVKTCVNSYCSAYSSYDSGWRNLTAPENVQASDGSHLNKVRVTWDSSTGATSYKVFRATSAGGTKSYQGSTSGTAFDDTSAVPGKMYFYWVTACVDSKCSSYSAYDIGWRMLTPPSNTQASDGTYTDKVRIYWNTSWGATSYKVYRATSAGGTKSQIGSPSGTVLDDASTTPGITYYYWVKACNGPLCSDYSSHDTGWRNLTPPSNLQATDGIYTMKVNLTWDATSGATSYDVYRATSESGAKSLLGNPTGTSFDDTSATPGITYYYWVKACAGSRCSDFSAYDTGWRMLTAPENVSASDGVYADKVRISWDPSSGATSFRIYRATSETGTKSEIGMVSGTSYDDTTGVPGMTYYYWVKACAGTHCSAFSTYDTGWIKPPKPVKPSNVEASDGTFTSKVQITWSSIPYATSYKVFRSTTPTGAKIYLGSSTGTSYDDTTASPAKAYYYRVKACNISGCSPLSAYDMGWRKTKKAFRSNPNHDGWVRESSEASNIGGSKNNTQTTLRVGDDARDRQYCSIISFNTKTLPDGAVITSATLKILKASVVGTDPFTTHGKLWAAIRKGYFGTSPALQASDFQAPPNSYSAAKFVPIPSTDWYRARVKASKLVYIDRAGFTQFRLCFNLQDDDDRSSDFIKFFSGNEVNKLYRPKLEVFYYVP